jgi:hypothetical protein
LLANGQSTKTGPFCGSILINEREQALLFLLVNPGQQTETGVVVKHGQQATAGLDLLVNPG